MKCHIIALFSLFLILHACSPLHFQTGRPFTLKKIEGLRAGETTREEVKRLFGEPQTTGRDDDGLETWTYHYIEAEVPLKGTPTKEKFQRLSITFDEEKVKSKSYELPPFLN